MTMYSHLDRHSPSLRGKHHCAGKKKGRLCYDVSRVRLPLSCQRHARFGVSGKIWKSAAISYAMRLFADVVPRFLVWVAYLGWRMGKFQALLCLSCSPMQPD